VFRVRVSEPVATASACVFYVLSEVCTDVRPTPNSVRASTFSRLMKCLEPPESSGPLSCEFPEKRPGTEIFPAGAGSPPIFVFFSFYPFD